MALRYSYFIHYQFRTQDEGIIGFGNNEITMDKEVLFLDDVRTMERRMQAMMQNPTVIICNYQLMRIRDSEEQNAIPGSRL